MRIVLATMQFGPGYSQGTERYVAMLAEGLRQRGDDVTILAGDPERRQQRGAAGAPVNGDAHLRHYPTHGWMTVRGLDAHAAGALLDSLSPDVVHVANAAHLGIGLLEAALQRRLPTFVTIMDFWWLCPKHTLLTAARRTCDARVSWQTCVRCIAGERPEPWARIAARLPFVGDLLLPRVMFARSRRAGLPADEIPRWKRRQRVLLDVLDRVTGIFCPSRAARQIIGPWLRHDRLHDVPYGLERRWFAAAEARPDPQPSAARDPATLHIGYAGALAPHKGVHTLLEALRLLGWTKTRVTIAGRVLDSAYGEKLKQLAAGLNVAFVGNVDSAQMPELLASLDVAILTSLWPENLPIVVLEAAAVGTPVLASDIAGVVESVPASRRFRPGDAESLAEALRRFAQGHTEEASAPPYRVSTADEMVAATRDQYAAALAGISGSPSPSSRT